MSCNFEALCFGSFTRELTILYSSLCSNPVKGIITRTRESVKRSVTSIFPQLVCAKFLAFGDN